MIKYSKLNDFRIKKVVECFCLDLTATQTTELLKLNRKTINKYYNVFRKEIFKYQVNQLRKFTGHIEVDESYFGPKRIRGRASKRGRGTHRQPVFGIFERDGRVYTEIIPNCNRRTLRKVITGKIDIKSTLYSDSWSGYNGLVDVGFNKHFRIRHKNDEFANRKGVHINGIEAFWSFTKRRLTKFNGTKKNFHLHLKESEWRWKRTINQLKESLYLILKEL